jgi:Ran GTPase-activating protein (RanGAP) involved in mRNA processing and transport
MALVIKRTETLTTLRLNDNRISDEGVKLLANVLSYPRRYLQKLYLHNNKLITDLSVEVLINMLEQNQSLNILWLIDCSITSHGRQRLQEAAASKRKFYLNI